MRRDDERTPVPHRDDGPRPSFATRLYRLLLSLYPRARRREDGEDMQEMFDDIYRYEPESQGAAGRARLAQATARDVLGGAVAERLPFLDMLAQDLRYGLRRLKEQPTLSVAAVFTLALGIGAVTSIFSFVDALVLDPLPYPEVDRIVAIGETTPARGLDGEGWLHPAEFEQVQSLEALESAAGLSLFMVTMTGEGDPEEIIGWRATGRFFDVLGVRPHIGRTFTDAPADADTVVLGHAFWQRRFGGDENVVGRALRLGDGQREVIGVMPRGAEWPMGTDLWVPLSLAPERSASYSEGSVRTIGRLVPGATMARLRSELGAVSAEARQAAPDQHDSSRIHTEPLLDNVTTYTRTALALLMGAAGFLLLLVCGNVANMQLAQATSRRREMAMRLALGAPRARLVRQLLTESVTLAALAAGAGTLLAIWSNQGLRAALTHERWRFYFAGIEDVGISLPVLSFAIAVSLASVILFGLVPALRSSNVALDAALKQSAVGGSRRGGRLRQALVTLEVALSVVLLFGAGLMAFSIGAQAAVDPGIDTEVLTVRLRLPNGYGDPARSRALFEGVLADVSGVPGIRSIALSNRAELSAGRGAALEVEPAAPDAPTEFRAERFIVAGDYFETLEIPILRGRALEPAEADAAVISDTLARRLWPDAEALGRRLRFGADEPWLTVVGVAGNVPRAWNDRRPSPSVYVPHAGFPDRRMRLLLDADGGGGGGGVIDALRDRIWALDDAVVVFAPESIAAAIDAEAGLPRAMADLVRWMAIAALLVCLSGVYALVAHAAGRRTREIGVRMALGASRRQVVRMLVLQGLRTSGLGLIIGLLLALGLATALAGFLQGVLTPDGSIFAAVAIGTLLLAALSSWWPARRAARVDPALTLRDE